MKQILAAACILALTGLGPADSPEITSIWMSQAQAHLGDVVRGRVVTSKNTASVEVRVGGYGMSLQKVGATTFVGSYRVPWVPFFLHRTWTVRVIARTIAGRATERDTAIAIR